MIAQAQKEPFMNRAIRKTKPSSSILLVDDHPMIRERLREVIDAEGDLAVCGEAATSSEALELAARLHPTLVIADLTLEGSHGMDLISRLAESFPEMRVLVFSMHDEVLHAERVLSAGAQGYIDKQQPTRKVLEAIRTVLGGEIYVSENISSRLAAKVAGRPRGHARLSIEALTNRELRVFELLGQGHGTREIGELLKIDMRTVETYRARIKEKLQFRDGNELLHHAIRWEQSGTLPTLERDVRPESL